MCGRGGDETWKDMEGHHAVLCVRAFYVRAGPFWVCDRAVSVSGGVGHIRLGWRAWCCARASTDWRPGAHDRVGQLLVEAVHGRARRLHEDMLWKGGRCWKDEWGNLLEAQLARQGMEVGKKLFGGWTVFLLRLQFITGQKKTCLNQQSFSLGWHNVVQWCLSVYLSIYLSVYLSVCLSICLAINLSISSTQLASLSLFHLITYLSIYLPTLSISPFHLSICLAVYLSICVAVPFSVM